MSEPHAPPTGTTIGKYIARFRQEKPRPREQRSDVHEQDFWWVQSRDDPSQSGRNTSSRGAASDHDPHDLRASQQSQERSLDWEVELLSELSESKINSHQSPPSSSSVSSSLSGSSMPSLLDSSSGSSQQPTPATLPQRFSKWKEDRFNVHFAHPRVSVEEPPILDDSFVMVPSHPAMSSPAHGHVGTRGDVEEEEEEGALLGDPEIVIQRIRRRLGFQPQLHGLSYGPPPLSMRESTSMSTSSSLSQPMYSPFRDEQLQMEELYSPMDAVQAGSSSHGSTRFTPLSTSLEFSSSMENDGGVGFLSASGDHEEPVFQEVDIPVDPFSASTTEPDVLVLANEEHGIGGDGGGSIARVELITGDETKEQLLSDEDLHLQPQDNREDHEDDTSVAAPSQERLSATETRGSESGECDNYASGGETDHDLIRSTGDVAFNGGIATMELSSDPVEEVQVQDGCGHGVAYREPAAQASDHKEEKKKEQEKPRLPPLSPARSPAFSPMFRTRRSSSSSLPSDLGDDSEQSGITTETAKTLDSLLSFVVQSWGENSAEAEHTQPPQLTTKSFEPLDLSFQEEEIEEDEEEEKRGEDKFDELCAGPTTSPNSFIHEDASENGESEEIFGANDDPIVEMLRHRIACFEQALHLRIQMDQQQENATAP